MSFVYYSRWDKYEFDENDNDFCSDINNSIMCLDTKLKECPGDSALQRTHEGLKNLCSDISRKTGLHRKFHSYMVLNYYTLLINSTI
jgi:hypothetical protein